MSGGRCVFSHPGRVDSSEHVGEPLLAEVEQDHQVEAAADEFIIFWLEEGKNIYFT